MSQAVEQRVLSGWKEIADYLGRSVRRTIDLESIGLPIRRVKGRVYAVTTDLIAWLDKTDETNPE